MFGMGISLTLYDFLRILPQSGVLPVALAIKYFSSLAALPGALFSISHNISGSLLASYWRPR